MELGWVWLHRKMKNWEWYTEPNTMRVFIHILISINHSDNQWRGIEIKRGETLTSIEHIAEELKLSNQMVRTSIKHLKSTGEITIKTTNKYSIITVNNFDKYNETNKPINKQLTSNQQTTNKQLTTNNNDNNEKNDNKNTGNEKKEIFSNTANRNETDKTSTRIKGLNYGTDGKIIHDEQWSDYMISRANILSEQSYQEEQQRKAKYHK